MKKKREKVFSSWLLALGNKILKIMNQQPRTNIIPPSNSVVNTSQKGVRLEREKRFCQAAGLLAVEFLYRPAVAGRFIAYRPAIDVCDSPKNNRVAVSV